MNQQTYTTSLIAFLMLIPCMAWATEQAPATFTIVRGNVDLVQQGNSVSQIASVGMPAAIGDQVRTQKRSRAQLRFLDDSILNLSSNYSIEIKEFSYDAEKKIRKSVIRSARGTLRAIINKDPNDTASIFEVETPTAVAAVRGTEFFVIVRSSEVTDIVVVKGSVSVRNINPKITGSVLIGPNQMTRINRGFVPAPARNVVTQSVQLLANNTSPKKEDLEEEGASGAAPITAPINTNKVKSMDASTPIAVVSEEEQKDTPKDQANDHIPAPQDKAPATQSVKTVNAAPVTPISIPITDPANVASPLVNVNIAIRFP
ncbi:MAG: FecR family protein [Mariprofundaceae bacterium]|nr:FecR family protein [Mariprofundaceae bacterium]